MKMTGDIRRVLPLIGASPRRFVRDLLVLFLPMTLLLLTALILTDRMEQVQECAKLKAREMLSAKSGRNALVLKRDIVVQDISYLVGDIIVRDAIELPSPASLKRLEDQFLNFSRAKRQFDKVRWIDEAGRERVRVDYRKGRAVVTPHARLQNKRNRYYFIETLKLNAGDVYVSPLDLNVEGGAIEVPYKPVLRIGAPVFDHHGRNRGIVVLTYSGKDLLDRFVLATGTAAGHAELLNHDGYWLRNPDAADEWGFMFGRKETFAVRHPEAWRRILAQDSGQFEIDGALWTFSTVYPFAVDEQEGIRTVPPFSEDPAHSKRGAYFWKVVLHTPSRTTTTIGRVRFILTVVALIAFSFAVSALLASGRARRRENEQRIRRQIDFTEALINNTAIAMFVLSESHRIIYWNRACEEMTGAPASRMIGTDDHWKAFYAEKRPCLADQLLNGELENIADLYESGHESMLLKGGWHAEGWFEKVGGKRRHLLVDTALIYDAAGTLVAAVETIQDDTGRKQAADQLAADERRFRALFERSSDAIFLVDRTTGRYLDANHSAELLTSRPVAELRQLRTIDLSARVEAEARLSRLAALTGNEEIGEAVYIRPDGTRREAILNAIALENDVIFGVAHDITDEKQAKKSLIASEARFRAIFENSAVAIGLTGEGMLVTVNTRYARLFGYERPDELAGRSIFDLIAPSERPRIRAYTEQRDRGASAPDIYETRGLTRAGDEFDIAVHVSSYLQEEKKYTAVVIEDVTELKRANKALVESLQQYRQLVMNMDQGLALYEMIYDGAGKAVDYRFVDANSSFEDMTGLRKRDIIGKTVKEILPGVENYWINLYARTVETGETIQFEDYSQDLGSYYEVVSFRPLPGQFAVIVSDITDRKRSEQLLEKRLELSAYAADHAIPDVLQKTLDLTEELTGSSIGFYHYYDEDKGEALLQQWSSRTVREFCKVEGYGLHYSINLAGVWTDCIRERRPVIHNDYARLPHKKGMPEGHAEVVRELVVPILRKDRIVAYLGIGNKKQDYTQQDVELVTFFADYAWDVVERKMAEIDLAETKQRLELAAASAQMGIWDWNVADDRTVWNDRMLELYGISREEFVGTAESWKHGVHPDDVERATAAVEKAFRGEGQYDVEFRVVHTTGKTLYIKADGMVMRDGSGQPVRMIGINRDVTVQRLLEEQLRHAQKMEAVGTLAGGVAHDFNNILSVILGYSNMLDMSLQRDSPLLGDVKNITKAAERASSLTHGLLAFSRKQAVNLRSVDLNGIVDDIRKMIVRLIGEQIELSVDLEAGALMVIADRNHLDQVILNLAANSRDAMPEGGHLSIMTSHVAVGPEFLRNGYEGVPGWYALLTVKDTGTGMDKATKNRIFEPFFTTKEVGRGTGLGLSMVYGIIKQHNGFIGIESEPGRGTEFRIYLPLAPAFHRGEESRNDELAILPGNGTILLVEDDQDARTVTRRLLERFGYTVLQAPDGVAALAVYGKHRSEISLIMTDVVMPRMNGRQLYEELRAMDSGIKVLFMSGYTADVVTLRELMDEGLPFLEKPMKPQVMANTIKAIIG